MLYIRLSLKQWRIWLLWEDARGLVHDPWLAEECTWEELQIETSLTNECIGNRCIEVNHDINLITFRLNAYLIF